jgi:hypothetical protein
MADAKRAEKQRILEEDAAMTSGIKPKAKTQAQKAVDKPWELALQPAVKKSNKGSRAPPSSSKASSVPSAAPARTAGPHDIVFTEDQEIFENRNREKSNALEGKIRPVYTWLKLFTSLASTVEDALSLLSTNDKVDSHPERRAKAVSCRVCL